MARFVNGNCGLQVSCFSLSMCILCGLKLKWVYLGPFTSQKKKKNQEPIPKTRQNCPIHYWESTEEMEVEVWVCVSETGAFLQKCARTVTAVQYICPVRVSFVGRGEGWINLFLVHPYLCFFPYISPVKWRTLLWTKGKFTTSCLCPWNVFRSVGANLLYREHLAACPFPGRAAETCN